MNGVFGGVVFNGRYQNMAFSRTIGNLRAKVNLFNDWSADLGEDNAPSAFVCFQIEAR